MLFHFGPKINIYMGHRLLLFIFCLSANVGLFAQEGYTLESVPDPKESGGGFVSDPSNYLNAAEVASLNQICRAIEDSTSAQVAIVLLPSIGQENPKAFATALFNQWGIGQADVDNGLLILSVMDQRRTEFETGYGLEGVLPDVVCYRIGMQELVPYFRDGQYGQGLEAALLRIQEILQNPEAAREIRSGGSPRPPAGIPWVWWIYLAVSVLAVSLMAFLAWRKMNSKDSLHDKYLGIRKYVLGVWIVLFPIPYLLLYFILKKVMHDLRHKPRFGPETGQPMHILSEEEEDVFLESGQITEEEIGSVDYDVWVTDDLEEVQILRYERRFTKYSRCPECKFKAWFHAKTDTVKAATYSSAGKGVRIYQCKNCGFEKKKYFTIAKKTRSSSGGGGGFSGGGGGSWGGGSSGGGGGGVSW